MKKIILLLCLSVLLSSCGDDKPNDSNDGFDRKKMLTFWADQMIIPAYTAFSKKTTDLKTASTTFTNSPSQANLTNLRNQWQETYILFQKVALFQIGKAKDPSVAYYINSYPTEVKEIKKNITSLNYNLEHINLSAQQGLPAIDYLINGLAADDTAILKFYTDGANASKYKKYLNDLTHRMSSISDDILSDWKGGYRERFISNDGNSLSSSVNEMVNAYVVLFYEVELRNKKIRIPLGGTINSETLPKYIEAYYKKDISKLLLTTALATAKDFFNGKSFDGNTTGTSLKQYLSFLKRDDLSKTINDQFKQIDQAVDALYDNLVQQIQTDKTKIDRTLQEIQKLVVSLKTDMAQSAMNIKIDSNQDGDND